MQCKTTTLVMLAVAASYSGAEAATIKAVASANSFTEESSPIAKVVTMLHEIKHEVEVDTRKNQMLFDRYGCWVERMIDEKTALVDEETKDIAEMQETILTLEAARGTSTAIVKNTKQDITDNNEAQKDADDQRAKEKAAYEAEKMENQNAQGALKAAVKVLTGTGMGGAFLESSHETQEVAVMSIVDRVRSAVERAFQSGMVSVSDSDARTIQEFLQRPTDFVGAGKPSLSAAQVDVQNNPFGDYAPRSNIIQGILKQMLADFTTDIAKNDAAEKEAAESYASVTATREKELEDLEKALETETLALADAKLKLADTRMLLEETKEDLKNDKQFIEDTKEASVKKTKEWNERSRFAAMELRGIMEAIRILKSNFDLFDRSRNTFLQISSVSVRVSKSEQDFSRLKQIATRSHSMKLAKIAMQFKAGWHFDKVIASLDDMLKILRDEEASDIAHKDRCESAQTANKNEMADLKNDISKIDLDIERLQVAQKTTTDLFNERQKTISAIKADMKRELEIRNEQRENFKKANEDDTLAIQVITKAMEALSKMQKKMSLVGVSQPEAEYTVDAEEAPDTSFAGPKKTLGQQSNVLSVMAMIREDIQKDLDATKAEEEETEADFRKSVQEQRDQIKRHEEAIATLTGQNADNSADQSDTQKRKTMKNSDLTAQEKLEVTLGKDCMWVEKSFDDRMKKRKAEMAGITEAKAFLSGAK